MLFIYRINIKNNEYLRELDISNSKITPKMANNPNRILFKLLIFLFLYYLNYSIQVRHTVRHFFTHTFQHTFLIIFLVNFTKFYYCTLKNTDKSFNINHWQKKKLNLVDSLCVWVNFFFLENCINYRLIKIYQMTKEYSIINYKIIYSFIVRKKFINFFCA